MTEPKTFDLEEVYDKQLAPLMEKIIGICNEHHVPMFATFLYKSDPEGVDDGEDCYCTTNLYFDDHAQSDTMEQLNAIRSRRPSPLRLTIRDKDGRIVKQEVIL